MEDACRAYDHFNYDARLNESKKDLKHREVAQSYQGRRCGTGEAWIDSFEVLSSTTRQPLEQIAYGEAFILRMRIISKTNLHSMGCLARGKAEAEYALDRMQRRYLAL